MKKRLPNLLTAGLLSCLLLAAGACPCAASDLALAGAEAAQAAADSGSGSAGGTSGNGTDSAGSTSGNGTDSAGSTAGAASEYSGRSAAADPHTPSVLVPLSETELLPADEMLTILGSHSTLTNELVAQEYEWIKVNLAGTYMPYVIAHAEGNPNVIHFLYMRAHEGTSPETFSYTDEEREAALPLLGEHTNALVPLLMQWDWRWGFDWYGGGPAGLTACAPTCMAMIGFGLTGDESITPRAMAAYAESSGYWVSGQGTSWDLVTHAFPNHAISCQRISADAYTIAAELAAGHPVLINVGVGKFSAVGHFMVLAGTDGSGNFILNDPNNLENCSRTWPWEELSTEIQAAWSYAYSLSTSSAGS